jgi:hypothetical protein
MTLTSAEQELAVAVHKFNDKPKAPTLTLTPILPHP